MGQAQPKNGYRQNRELAIICALWGVLIFFRLDDLIGAAGLRHFYLRGSLVAALVVLMTILVLDVLWKDKRWISLMLPIFLLFSCALVTGFAFIAVWFFVGAIFVALMPSWIFVASLLYSVGLCLYNSFRPKDFNPTFVKSAVTLLSVFTIIFVLGAGYRNGGRVRSSESFAGHHYYLIAYVGDMGDSDVVIFYECNAWALACQDYHRFRTRDYSDAEILLIPDATQSQITARVDDDIYRHVPSP